MKIQSSWHPSGGWAPFLAVCIAKCNDLIFIKRVVYPIANPQGVLSRLTDEFKNLGIRGKRQPNVQLCMLIES